MRNDWTNRRSTALGLIVTAVSVGVALISSTAIGYLFAAVLGLAGIALLLFDWRIIKSAPDEAQLSTEFIPKDLQIGSPFYRRAGGVPRIAGILLVHNTGPSTIKCRVVICVNDGISEWPSQQVYASWYGCRSSHINIESGKSAEAVIAVLKKISSDYRWKVPYWLEEELHSSYTKDFCVVDKSVTRAQAHITVTVMSEPFPSDGLPTHSFIIEGQKIYESKA